MKWDLWQLKRRTKMEWFFDGLGTELISIGIGLILGAGVGGVAGYRVGINKSTLKQTQKAGDDSKQKQTGKSIVGVEEDNLNIESSDFKIKQNQKAGNGAVQTQIGGISHGKR